MKNKNGEIGTIVMMILLVVVSIIGFSSSSFLSQKQSVNTKAEGNICGPYHNPEEPAVPIGSCAITSTANSTNNYDWYRCISVDNLQIDPTCDRDASAKFANHHKRCCYSDLCLKQASIDPYNYTSCTDSANPAAPDVPAATDTPIPANNPNSPSTPTATGNLYVEGNHSTKCLLGDNCGSGGGSGNYLCTIDNGCAPAQCTTAHLEFACCVADMKDKEGPGLYRIQWYGCTGQPCQKTKISGTALGTLAGCAGYSRDYQKKSYPLTGNAVNFPQPTAPPAPTDTPQPGGGASGSTNTPTPPYQGCDDFVGTCNNSPCRFNHDPNWSCKNGHFCCPPEASAPLLTSTPTLTPIPYNGCTNYGAICPQMCQYKGNDYTCDSSGNCCKITGGSSGTGTGKGTGIPAATETPIPTPTVKLGECTAMLCPHIDYYIEVPYWEKCMTSKICNYYSDNGCSTNIPVADTFTDKYYHRSDLEKYCLQGNRQLEKKVITINVIVTLLGTRTDFDIKNPSVTISLYKDMGRIDKKEIRSLDFPLAYSYTEKNVDMNEKFSARADIRTVNNSSKKFSSEGEAVGYMYGESDINLHINIKAN